MFAFQVRCVAAGAVRGAFVSLLAGAGSLSAGGCANTNSAYYSSASASAYVAQGTPVQTESDGLPVQAAPSANIRQLPDDPSEPYSPNYGGYNPASKLPSQPLVRASNEGTGLRPAIPDDLPPAFRRQLVATVAGAG